MDLLLEGILIAIMIAIILIFVVYEYITFFAPKSSIGYYDSLVTMADSACTSIQTASNVQFSSPTIFVFQMYDPQACNSILSSNAYIFSPNSAVLSSLNGNYDLCYANVSNPAALGVSSGNQYFLKRSTNDYINFYYPKEYSIPKSSNMSSLSELNTAGVEVNSSSPFSVILNAYSAVNPSNYTFNLNEYSNTSINLDVYFNGQTSCGVDYSNLYGVQSFSISSPCQQKVNNLTVSVLPSGSQETNYQFNVTAKPDLSPTSSYLSQQCTNLVSLVSRGVISNGSIVCQPIICGGNSFYLADQSNRPFLGLYGESFTFLGVQSGVNDLQIVNSYSEQLINSSLMDETVFVEEGLPSSTSWSVTYNGVTKSVRTGLTSGGNTIAFSNQPGNYSFSVPDTTGLVGDRGDTFLPNATKGYALQGSYVTVKFSLSYP